MHRATVIVEHPRAEVIERTLSPESRVEIPRTSVKVSREGDRVKLEMKSGDVNGLRAAMNSYLRWMEMAATIAGKVGE